MVFTLQTHIDPTLSDAAAYYTGQSALKFQHRYVSTSCMGLMVTR